MMKKSIGHVVALLLVTSIALAGCGNSTINVNDGIGFEEISEDISGADISSVEITAPAYQETNPKEELTDFALNILKSSQLEDNVLISPLSIVSALGMTANGAANDTLQQMETVMQTDSDSLNDFLEAYVKYMASEEEYKVNIANSIWIKDREDLNVKEKFLSDNKTYYDAEIFTATFDEQTKNDINNWVAEETDGMIDHLLDDVPSDAIMYLINALSFDAEWAEVYSTTDISNDVFTTVNGEERDVEFMNSEEYYYLEIENATGFVKPYVDEEYAFVALLPNEGIEISDFIQELDGEILMDTLENSSNEIVYTRMPKFSVEYSTILNDALVNLGMEDAFDSSKADFSGIAEFDTENIFISKVIHKTKIEVDEKGTKAGAVTAVEMKVTSAMPVEEPKEVILNRPFVYMIIDMEHNFPIFIGSLTDIS